MGKKPETEPRQSRGKDLQMSQDTGREPQSVASVAWHFSAGLGGSPWSKVRAEF